MEQTTSATVDGTSTENTPPLFWGRTGDEWDSSLILSLIAVAIVATFVVIATVGSINAHKRESAEAELKLAKFKSSMDLQVSAANDSAARGVADGEAAKAQAAEANATAATANERAAKLENEAAQAKLELQHLRLQMAWRRLTEEQIQRMAQLIKAGGNNFEILKMNSDPEVGQLAEDFGVVFKLAFGTTPNIITGLGGGPFTGIAISGPDAPSKLALLQIFGKDFEIADGGITPKLTLIIGGKPPMK